MAQLNFYVADAVDSSLVRQQLNDIAAELGFIAKSGPTAGTGNASAMLLAIAHGGLKVMPSFTIHIPKVGWDADHTALVEQHIDDETFLSVDLIATRMPGDWEPGDVVAGHLSERFHVRHAVIVRREDNTEVRHVSRREIELVWD